MKDYADSSILPKKEDSTGNCSAEKVEKLEFGVARYADIYPPSGSTCYFLDLVPSQDVKQTFRNIIT